MTTIKKPDQQVLNRALCAGLAGIYIAPCNLDQIGAYANHTSVLLNDLATCKLLGIKGTCICKRKLPLSLFPKPLKSMEHYLTTHFLITLMQEQKLTSFAVNMAFSPRRQMLICVVLGALSALLRQNMKINSWIMMPFLEG